MKRIKFQTLSQILKGIANYLKMSEDDFIKKLFFEK